MPLPTSFKGAVGIAAAAGTVLLGLTVTLAAVNPAPVRAPDSWRLAKPALKIDRETLRRRKATNPTTTPRLKINPGPPNMRKASPGPPNMRKVNPDLPAVQTNPGPPERR